MGDYKAKKSKAAHDLGVNSKKGMPANEHWQIKVPCTAYGDGDNPSGAFLPTPGKNRAQPHVKINEVDH